MFGMEKIQAFEFHWQSLCIKEIEIKWFKKWKVFLVGRDRDVSVAIGWRLCISKMGNVVCI